MVLLQVFTNENGRYELWLVTPFKVMWVNVRNKRVFTKGSTISSRLYQVINCSSGLMICKDCVL